LFVCEIIVLTVWVDAGGLHKGATWWSDLLIQAPKLLGVAIAAVAAALLLVRRGFWEELRRDCEASTSPVRPGPFLLGHLGFMALFGWASAEIFEGELLSSAWPVFWVSLWAALGLMSLGLWALAIMPADVWLRLVKRTWPALLGAGGLGLAAWFAGWIAKHFWTRFGLATVWTAYGLLQAIYPDAVCEPGSFAVGTPDFAVTITPACSGYEGIGLISAFLVAYLWLFREQFSFPRAFLLLPVGAVLSWVANAVRIAVIVGIGTAGWPEVALGAFHSQAGLLAFTALALGLVAVSSRLPFFNPAALPRRTAWRLDPTVAYLGPFLAILATGMLTGAVAGGFDRLYPLRVMVGAAALYAFRHAYTGLRPLRAWEPATLGAGVFVLWLCLAIPASDGPGMDGLAHMPGAEAVLWLVARTAGYVIVTPLAEELAFRGYLTRRLVATDFVKVNAGRFSWAPFLISSALFGMMHGDCWLAGTLAGMLFALALYRRGRIGDAVLAHMVANGLITLYVFTTGDWSVWS